MSTANPRLNWALWHAHWGFRVFPCHEIEGDRACSCGKLKFDKAGKHSRVKDWQSLATRDEAQIQAWWEDEYPEANIGIACGQQSNLTVLDVDGEQGKRTLRDLELEHGELLETPIAITGSGEGNHYLFQYEPDLQHAVKFAPGLDSRTEAA